ncbi:MAG: hypothetical protein HRU10_07115 [Opitutales bacterium]|nr:hypothetical protein [Opitutales bacterium]
MKPASWAPTAAGRPARCPSVLGSPNPLKYQTGVNKGSKTVSEIHIHPNVNMITICQHYEKSDAGGSKIFETPVSAQDIVNSEDGIRMHVIIPNGDIHWYERPSGAYSGAKVGEALFLQGQDIGGVHLYRDNQTAWLLNNGSFGKLSN